MSLNSFTTVRLWMCSQSLLELKLFGEEAVSHSSLLPLFVTDYYPSLLHTDNYSTVTAR